MKERTKRIILWVVFIWSIYSFINIIFAIIDFPSFLSYLEKYGLDTSSTGLIRAIVLFWLLIDSGIIILVYKKLFSKKEDKSNIL